MTAQQLGPDGAEQTLDAVNFQRWQVGEWQREWGLVGSRDRRMRNPLKREIPACEVDVGTMDDETKRSLSVVIHQHLNGRTRVSSTA